MNIEKDDVDFIKNALLPKLGIRYVYLGWSDSKKTYPDVWCYPETNTIIVTREWTRQSKQERQKRLTHEALHLIGMEHDSTIGYNSHPKVDTYSKKIYRELIQ